MSMSRQHGWISLPWTVCTHILHKFVCGLNKGMVALPTCCVIVETHFVTGVVPLVPNTSDKLLHV